MHDRPCGLPQGDPEITCEQRSGANLEQLVDGEHHEKRHRRRPIRRVARRHAANHARTLRCAAGIVAVISASVHPCNSLGADLTVGGGDPPIRPRPPPRARSAGRAASRPRTPVRQRDRDQQRQRPAPIASALARSARPDESKRPTPKRPSSNPREQPSSIDVQRASPKSRMYTPRGRSTCQQPLSRHDDPCPNPRAAKGALRASPPIERAMKP